MKHEVSFRFAPGLDMLVLTIEDLRRGVDCPSKITCRSMRNRVLGICRSEVGKGLLQGLGVLRHCSTRRSSECRVCVNRKGTKAGSKHDLPPSLH
jgi:hypothetical protein